MFKHGFLILTGRATEIAKEATTGHHHFMGSILLFRNYFSLAARSLDLSLGLSIRLGLSSTTCGEKRTRSFLIHSKQ